MFWSLCLGKIKISPCNIAFLQSSPCMSTFLTHTYINIHFSPYNTTFFQSSPYMSACNSYNVRGNYDSNSPFHTLFLALHNDDT